LAAAVDVVYAAHSVYFTGFTDDFLKLGLFAHQRTFAAPARAVTA